ncbi:lysophospholipid acyltransferase 5-like protein [Dinothrombium tinctorium]|uniref:Lysophospholipid acyltransferase 5 n=1 Tax=Dinothrombium tinctorium TaxID=1965070 RepID=A0A3S3S0I1_9ACAR|nr:lysophospholipid acyltransferase 5-like protein [Dinothrombium tinctorium]
MMNYGPNLLEYLLPGYATFSLFKWLAVKIGCHEAALRLIVSLILGYPLCVLYNVALIKHSSFVKHFYFFLCGFSLGFFIYGFRIFHTFATIILVYSILNVVKNKKIALFVTFTFCMSYLLWGYYMTQTDEYAFEWTIPQCVLTLRLIALAFDVFDGYKMSTLQKKLSISKAEALKMVSNANALNTPPSLLHLLSHCYFPGSFLVGPQVAFKQYTQFVTDTNNHLPVCLNQGLKRFILGLIYLAVFQIGSFYWPLKYLISSDFQQLNNFLLKFTYVAITMKIQLCKYVSIWLLSEGCCVISGLTYEKETNTFDSCSNIKVWEFETTPTFGGIIRSFNITTNAFAAKYIFKRLKFLGSKALSHFVTLFFLALWHGWKSGYYMTFFMEFLIMKMEWEASILFFHSNLRLHLFYRTIGAKSTSRCDS